MLDQKDVQRGETHDIPQDGDPCSAEDVGKEARFTEQDSDLAAKRRKRKEYVKPYVAGGITAVIVVLICLVIFFFIYRFQGFSSGLRQIISSLQGVIIGFLIAYLLNPIMKFFERNLTKRRPPQTQKAKFRIRALSVTLAMVIFLAIIVALALMIIPQMIVSIQDLALTLSDKMDALTEWMQRMVHNSTVEGQLETYAQKLYENLAAWLENKIMSNGPEIVTTLTSGVYAGIKIVINCLVGLIVAIYVLMTKERFVGQAKKLIYAIFKPKHGNIVMEFVQKADDIFGGYFIGEIIDALIIGFLCLAGTTIMKMPYAPLISVIVGVTNIIPFFGPYIGAIPSIILLLLADPIKALYFTIFIICLQQADGNVIKPKVLGDTIGLSPFWIVFSILLFGGCFGVIGMLLGVPVFALIYYVVKRIAEYLLRRSKLPEETEAYVLLNRVDEQTNQIKLRDKEKKSAMHPAYNKKQKK